MSSPTKLSPPEAPPPDPVTVDSDIVVILAALLCALICVVGLALVARCAWIRRSSTGAGGGQPPAPANKGLKKKILRSLPKLSFDGTFSADCAICLTEFSNGDEIRVLPQCGHAFHVACIDTWLVSHSSCPSCRQILVVARCQRCGRFPATAREMKPMEDDDANRFLP